ncbi:SNF2-related protein [Mucilaginibacter sp. KACC 22773]|uniref:DEAD/DEAH box helicase n=1 Tax=Mucilaginibacter sp. KACC 22773 TaxID=3025671 RepID=UPI00236664A8|nr:DEAD/DEAH box helicase [Mucilaginibacter sp. KACC 22773]WDF80720.1 SNF2-related protein [Mucilaginibacter sp. KACC 22773]
MDTAAIYEEDEPGGHTYILDLPFAAITETAILQRSGGGYDNHPAYYKHIVPEVIEINSGVFYHEFDAVNFPQVTIVQNNQQLLLTCGCTASHGLLCEHQTLVLTAVIKKNDLRIYFDSRLRDEKIRKAAIDYGLENEPDLDAFFKVTYIDKQSVIVPRLPSLIPVTKDSLAQYGEMLLPADAAITDKTDGDTGQSICIVLKQHKYYQYLFVELYSAQITKEGKIKNPLTLVNPLDQIWSTDDHEQLKFFTGINKFQNHINSKRSAADILALRAIIKNPLKYNFYYHNSQVSDNITASSIVSVKVGLLPQNISLNIKPQGPFYEFSGQLTIDGEVHQLKDLGIRFSYFILVKDKLYLADNIQLLGIIDLMRKRPENLLIHHSKYKEFKTQLLTKLEDRITIAYQHIKPATQAQLKQQGFTAETEQIIYLSDFGSHVMIIPVMRYGEAEIPVRTKRTIHGVDHKGNEFIVKRDDEAEIALTALLVRQHPYFDEQLDNDLHYFYLHKRHFLQEEWFLNVFEDWRQHGITVLGFNELEGNKLNANKVNITIRVLSGINWFNTEIGIRFGKTKTSLKRVQKAVRNKSKYVQLDDGTVGILPLEWIERFTKYFNAGEVTDEDILSIHKINYAAIDELFDQQVMDEEVKAELFTYREKLADFDKITHVEVSADLKTTLRPYQQQGLNWLNFLDDFNFGGCLADDMGLGKTMQIIAFILSQRNKRDRNTNLLVVPTSIIFNWQAEVKKFAPSIRMHTIYGADRMKNTSEFDGYEIILTSYGTLLADIGFLKHYQFNYVFLDESQQIKNPDSQRYKAVRLLKSRNRIAITGTPIENNTFDIYGQLSFACPGLLGTKQYFKDIYAVPIDKFKSHKRAAELQHKIKPFVLRRTKQQVAAELPEKTEMVLYCEMKEQQRKIYDAYEKEFREYISATTSDELRKTPMNVLKGLTKLRQICDSPLLIDGEKPPGSESAKIEMLIEQIESKQHQHKILVFSQFVSMLELIRKELLSRKIEFCWLTGSTRNREAVVNEFQNNPKISVFLISMKAGGTGLNLTEADYVYIVDPWWNPAVENQAIDRSHRIGQSKHVVAVRMICPDTVEEKIMQMQDFKRSLADNLVNTDSSFLQSMSKTDLLGILG